ncbi:hypothetical protein ACNBR5_000118 [Shigella sonnei]|jgi:hypothetical protein
MGILGNMKAGFLKALEKAAAIVSMTGKQVGVDASAVAQVLASQIEQQPYIYVGRGKGGKKQAHRQSGAAAIKRAAKKARNRNRKRNKKVK